MTKDISPVSTGWLYGWWRWARTTTLSPSVWESNQKQSLLS